MKVPNGKTVWIGNKEYKAGMELPATYTLPEKNKSHSVKKESEKK